ncbi:MAG TPA: response regulator transcription factor [Nitriliruptorales bacterium]|nr:response regulator transcription factor [Nitriliruptorales bacterium]
MSTAEAALRQTLAVALQRKGFVAEAVAPEADELTSRARQLAATVTLLDASPTTSPCELSLRDELPDVRVLLLATSGQDDVGLPARFDHVEVVPAHLALDDLVDVLNGERTVAEAAARRPRPDTPSGRADPSPIGQLTARERQVLEALIGGATNTRIAESLGISRHTVRTHLQNIFAKLGVHNRLEAVALGLRAGLRPASHKAPWTAIGEGR